MTKAKIIKSMLVPILGISTVAAATPMVTSCGEKKAEPVDQTVHVTGITANNPNIQLIVKETKELSFTIYPKEATNQKVTWKSSNPEFVTVDKNGLVTALKEGKATITVTTEDGGHTATCLVTVKPVAVTNISLNKNEMTLYENASEQLTVTILPKAASDNKVEWQSSNPSVAIVDQDGIVHALKDGEATITVTVVDSNKAATCVVTVKHNIVPVESISLNKETIQLFDDQSEQLIVTFIPTNATNKNVTWTSSNPEVATVDESGAVHALNEGTTTITVTTEDANKTCSLKVVVVDPSSVTGVTLNKTNCEILLDETEQLIATVLPRTAKNKNVSWSSNNEEVATVDQNGLVTALKEGEATITVITQDRGFMTTCKIIVKPNLIPVTGIELDKTELELYVGKNKQLNAKVLPETATNKQINWVSSDNTIVTIDQDGTVHALKDGEATITISAVGGSGVTVECKVVVKPILVEEIKLNKTELGLEVDQTQQLIATVSPENATYKTINWKSSNEEVATVDQTGIVVAISEGTVTITASATDDSGKSSTCLITITPKPVLVTGVELDKKTLELIVDKSQQLTATVLPLNASNKKVTWTSSDESVATVDQKGIVYAISKGVATITVITEDGNKFATCEVTVKTIPVNSVHINNRGEKLHLGVGITTQLTATVLPENATNKEVVWSSSNPEIATVDENGLVKTLYTGGTTTITVTTLDGSYSDSCVLTVYQKVTRIKLDKTKLQLFAGQEEQLTATIYPSYATNKNITWKSSDESIATVDENGQIKTSSSGQTTITVATEDGGLEATCELTILDPSKVVGVELDQQEMTLLASQSKRLYVNILPSTAINQNVIWTSTDESIAYVGFGGKNYCWIEAKAPGTVTITATTEDGGFSATCKVIVEEYVDLKGVSFEEPNITMYVGETTTPTINFIPQNATNKDVIFTSKNPEIASIDMSNGIITAIQQGIATIEVTTLNKVLKATCQVVVCPIIPVTAVRLNKYEVIIDDMDNFENDLKALIYPEDATNKNVTWSSDDEKVVVVTQEGKIIPQGPGTATIAVRTVDGSNLATYCRVVVNSYSMENVLLNKNDIVLNPNDTAILFPIFVPQNATNKKVIWSSTNTQVATVDLDGNVIAIAPGQAEVIITTEDGNKTAKCKVTVRIPVDDIDLNKTQIELTVGQEEQLIAFILPEFATSKDVIWSSNNEGVATVDENGKVTAIASGIAVIAVRCAVDPMKVMVCQVIVR